MPEHPVAKLYREINAPLSEAHKWGGLIVSENDHDDLVLDTAVFGTAFVQDIGNGHGRRINPRDVLIFRSPVDKAKRED